MKRLLLTSLVASLILSVGSTAQAEESSTTEETEKQLMLGKRAFIRCVACHSLAEGEAHRTGPNLHGLFGATAGQKEGFAYSDALKNSTMEWNDENLRAWLLSPATVIPGNKMAFGGVPSEKELDALMAYLAEMTK